MATARLVASTYYLSSTTYLSISNTSNMYTNTDSDTYATVTNSQTGTTSYYLYIRGFNFSAIPSGAVINSWTVKLKARESGISTSSSYAPKLCNGTSQITSTCTAVSTTATVHEFTGVSVDWDTIVGYGSNFGIRINCRRSSRNTTGYMYVYGAEIEVDYTLPDPRTITTTLSGDGTISPSGTTTSYDGMEFELTITPTTKGDPVTVTNNGTDVTGDLEEHYASGTESTVSETAESYTTELSASGANFYTSSSSTGNYFNYAVGHTAESPGSTSTSYNTYVKDNSNNTATGWAWYTFDFSAIPSNAEIESVEVKCYGACESTTHDSTHKANITLYSGSNLKSTEQYFTSTSNSTITITDPGDWTRDELLDARLKFEVAYYGGRLFGITWKVTYMVGTTPDYYTYVYTVSGDATIAVVIGTPETNSLWFKSNGSWVQAAVVYKKVNGSWVEQSDLTNVFVSGVNYVKG